MNKGQLKSMVAAMEARGVPDSASVFVKVVGSESPMQLNGSSFIEQGQDSEVSLDANDNFAGVVTEISAVFLKQD